MADDDPPLQLDHTENEPYNCDIELVKVPLDAVDPDERKKAKDKKKTGKGKRGKDKCKHGKGRTEKAITYKFKELLAKHIAAYCNCFKTVAVNTDMDVDGAGVNEVGKAKDAADTAKNVDAAKKVGNTKEAARGQRAQECS
ncbi:hypothetical protein H4S04_003903 [Coemansia sp. S16]|nr:hypothetical protein H4S04_003903 [Coemansia sp. S16]